MVPSDLATLCKTSVTFLPLIKPSSLLLTVQKDQRYLKILVFKMLIIDEINHSEGEFTKAQRAFLHKLFLINSSKVVAERAGASFPPCAYLTMQYRNKIGPTLLNS